MTTHLPPPLKALAARMSPRRYLTALVVEAIREERRESNLRAVEYERRLAEDMIERHAYLVDRLSAPETMSRDEAMAAYRDDQPYAQRDM